MHLLLSFFRIYFSIQDNVGGTKRKIPHSLATKRFAQLRQIFAVSAP